uniref:SOUL heme-binding protein n=1 Tax=Aureoumbra lagunensis TaxID=44058 RepID=A0A7S3K6H3_9STRA
MVHHYSMRDVIRFLRYGFEEEVVLLGNAPPEFRKKYKLKKKKEPIRDVFRELCFWTCVVYIGKTYLGLLAWYNLNLRARPKYQVLQRFSRNIEVRKYESYVVAEATIPIKDSKDSMLRNESISGRRKLVEYIFDGKQENTKKKKKMQMLIPVITTYPLDKKTLTVSFIIQFNETIQTLPKPSDTDIKLRQIPAHTAVYIRFKGPKPSQSLVATKRKLLEQVLARHGYKFRPSRKFPHTLYAQYHDSLVTPGILCRNEVGFYLQ